MPQLNALLHFHQEGIVFSPWLLVLLEVAKNKNSYSIKATEVFVLFCCLVLFFLKT